MTWYDVSPLLHPGVKILPKSTDKGIELEFVGEISMENPSKIFFPYVEKVHREALEHGASEVCLNLTKLSYLNSSGILMFMKWVKLIQGAPPDLHYMLHIVYSKAIAWQRVGMRTLRKMAPSVVDLTEME
ncbi:MAG: hypothetical protein JSV08_03875 [Acidobacteriota bacterium]|nr:MAG: hypothetical protein JSV08_03875 [Acidobacteriota bacterium]